MKKNSTNSYSGLQYFLWLLAGSEISVLSKCPNDYNRHANIGLMILMTSIFASFTGFIAGFTFSHSILGAMLFAVIWGALIFSLDRSMVNSIKKDPTQAEKSMMQYFWPRFFLAVILSFFMSIPLDHIVFKEKIEFQMLENNKNNILNTKQQYSGFYGIEQDSAKSSRLAEKSNDLEKNLNKDCSSCPFEEYKLAAKRAKEIEKNELPALKTKMNTAQSEFYAYLGKLRRQQTPSGEPLISIKDIEWDSKLNSLNSTKRSANSAYSGKIGEANTKITEANAVCAKWKSELKAKKDSIDNKLAKTDSILEVNRDSVKILSTQYKDKISDMNGFDTQFVTLFLMPDFGVQFLKWLIFLALLVIEILPTYLKLKTPIGQYDWMMYKQERETELETRSRLNALETELNDIEEYRKNKEIGMNKKIIDKVVDIEEKLANEMLEEWESKAREEMMGNVSKS